MTIARRPTALGARIEPGTVCLDPEVEALVVQGLRRCARGQQLVAAQQAAFDEWFSLPDVEGLGSPFEQLTVDELRGLEDDQRWMERRPSGTPRVRPRRPIR